jgi:ABC-2 type transport system permease protein
MILFRTTLKRCLKKPIIIITLLIMPLLCLVIDHPFKGSNDAKTLNNFTIAISDNDNSVSSKALVDKISSQYSVDKASEKEINTLLTNKSCDWAIVISKNFQNNLKNEDKTLIESYGFVQKEKWEPVKLNIENMLSSMKIIYAASDNATLKQNLMIWVTGTKNNNFIFLNRSKGPLTPGTGLTLYGIIILYGAFLLSRLFVEDKENELTVRIATSPIPPWRYLLENLACFSVILIVQNLLMVLAYRIVNPLGMVHPFMILLAFSAYSITAVGLMLTISTVCNTSFVMMCTSTMATLLLSLFGGLLLPIAAMPDTMKKIAMVTPTYWFSEAINSIFAASNGFTFQLTMLLGFALVFFLAGSWKKYSKLD